MSLKPKKLNDGRAKQLHEKRWSAMASKMVENVVLESTISVFSLTGLVNEADVAHCVSPISKREFKSIRRGSRTRLGRAGFDSKKTLTDRRLREILESWNIEVR